MGRANATAANLPRRMASDNECRTAQSLFLRHPHPPEQPTTNQPQLVPPPLWHHLQVPIGRADATAADPPGRMASEKADAALLKANFAEKGFSVQEMVALSGAHTLGGCTSGGWLHADEQRQQAVPTTAGTACNALCWVLLRALMLAHAARGLGPTVGTPVQSTLTRVSPRPLPAEPIPPAPHTTARTQAARALVTP